MPGTIHVSVLDFSDLPSTSSSSVLFKVSMGKREYQTLDKGDFSFPVKSLHEKLILVVLDDAGSKLCQTVVEAILVVQKGQWDDYFSLDDGGRVRMRLQFVLSDEDRVKIRKMRDSALRKQRSQLLITHPELRKTISLDVGVQNNDISVDILSQRNDGNEDVKTSPVYDSVSFSNTQLSIHDENKEGDTVNKEQINPVKSDRDRTEEAMPPSTVSDVATIRSADVNSGSLVENQEVDKQYVDKSPGALNFKLSTFSGKGKLFIPKVDDQVGTNIIEAKLRKTPSSVRKMISAFECNTTQDTKSRNKPPPLKTPINKLGLENPSQELIADEVIVAAATKKLTEMSSEIVVSPSFFSELRQKVSVKKRQISYDVVEIITIAPERGLAEASAVELVSKPPGKETCDRFKVMTEDVIIDDMTSREDDKTVPTFETRDNVELKDMEVENKDMQFFDDNINFLTVEKDSINRPQVDSDTKCYDPPREQMRNLNDETENSICAQYTLLVTKDGNGPENDDMCSTKQLLFDGTPLDNQNPENSIGAEDTLLVIEDASGPENDRATTVYGDSLDDTRFAKQLHFDDTLSYNQNSGGGTIKVISENKPPSEDPQHVNKGTMRSTKLENTKSVIEWSPTSEPRSSWVFPDESRASCIAPSSIQLTNSIGGSKVETNINNLEHSTHSAGKPCQERKHVNKSSRSPGTNDSAGDGNPRGQFAQAIKIAIMVAFGSLVFLSRQRNHK